MLLSTRPATPALQNRRVPLFACAKAFCLSTATAGRLARSGVVDEVEVVEFVSCACSLMSCSSRFDCVLFDVPLLVELSLLDDAAVVMLTFDPSA